jgi:hypothetical protein
VTLPRRAITVVEGVEQLRTGQGPALVEYVHLIDLGEVFRWSPGADLTDDGKNAINASGGFPGAYVRVRRAVAGSQGANLTASVAQTLLTSEGELRLIPAATLSANIVLTMDPENAEAPDLIEISRFDVGAFTVAIVNGGPAAGTLVTLPVSVRANAVVQFNGTNFILRRSGLML